MMIKLTSFLKNKAMRQVRQASGQMTVELCIVFPVAVILALIVVNAMTFFAYCADFDRASRNLVRVNATAQAHGQSAADAVSAIKSDLSNAFSEDNLNVRVESQSTGFGPATYKMTLEYSPTLFGLGMRSEVLGVSIPKLTHNSSITVSPYRPGIVF